MPRDERPLMAGADTPHVQTSTPTTAPSAAESPLPDTASLPMLRDVRVQKQRLPWMLIVVILVIGAIAGLVGAWAGTRQVGYFLCIGLSIPLFIMVSARIGDRATRKRLQAAAERGGQDPTSAMAEAVSRRVFWPSRAPPLLEMAKLLVGRGRLGESIRMQWQGEFEPVQPLTVAFEPRLLDESDAAFTELEAATICEPAAEGASPPVPAYRDNSPAFGHVRRNLRLKGGWAFVIMFAAFMFRSALESYQRGAITWELPFWTTMMFLFLLGPTRGGPYERAQWLLVPGGVLVRKAVRRSTRSRLHLFDRRRSTLCLSQYRRQRWLVVAADAEECEQTLATDREAHFLLRAWLSPLEPPPADRLTDLT